MRLQNCLRHLACALLTTVLLLHSGTASALTVLFISDRDTPTTNEVPRINQLTAWGYTVQTLNESSTQAAFDSAANLADVVYFSSEADHSGFSNYNICTGVVLETPDLVQEFGFASSANNTSTTTTIISNTSHYITSGYPSGNVSIFTTSNRVTYLDGTVAAAVTRLAYDPTSNGISLGTLEIGDALYAGGFASGRRVWLPWGISNMDFTEVSTDGLVFMQRAIEWAAASNACTRLTKRAFLADGTPVADGTTLPTGTKVDFLLYINNNGGFQSNVSLQDILDPAFAYQTDSMTIDNSLFSCATSPCTAAEEATILAAAKGGTAVSDPPDGDVGSINGTTIHFGRAVQPSNSALNIAANRVWALVFTVDIQ